VLDGLMHHGATLEIKEHYTDTGGANDHVFGLCHLLGYGTSATGGSARSSRQPSTRAWNRCSVSRSGST
jgi:hypothetical protein